jgi:UDPglucose 6-dehydrogenase
MRVESAEMTKHALNAFLATSVAFINEIGTTCEAVGADAKEVERGLKSESRIGPGAYLAPGGAFAGGTLARDVGFLIRVRSGAGSQSPLLSGVKQSNDLHRQWPRRRLEEELGDLRGRSVTVLGLTYKANTSTLRRSESIALCQWLLGKEAIVRAYDPGIDRGDSTLPSSLILCDDIDSALADADAVVVATPWPAFKDLTADRISSKVRTPVVLLDADRFLAASLTGDPRIRYLAVGTPRRLA